MSAIFAFVLGLIQPGQYEQEAYNEPDEDVDWDSVPGSNFFGSSDKDIFDTGAGLIPIDQYDEDYLKYLR